jgi:hypothetical protein
MDGGIVWAVSSWRSHGIWQWHRHWRCYDCRYDWYHGRAVYEPGARIHVRDAEKRCDLFILIPMHAKLGVIACVIRFSVLYVDYCLIFMLPVSVK